jgi:hypothetical protein
MTEKIFKAISTFVSDLGECFSQDNHALALYERLLNKTQLAHTEAVEKHITAFRNFCLENKDAIVERKETFSCSIVYSQKVFIDMNIIFKLNIDEDTRNTIWSHLLTIYALVDPSGPARNMLIKSQSVVKFEGDGEEDDFLNNVISKVEKHINPDTTNPQEAIASIMSSGMITDLVSSLNTGISSGKLDLAKMMGSVQKMVGTMSDSGSGDPGTMDAMNMLNSMMGMMGQK